MLSTVLEYAFGTATRLDCNIPSNNLKVLEYGTYLLLYLSLLSSFQEHIT